GFELLDETDVLLVFTQDMLNCVNLAGVGIGGGVDEASGAFADEADDLVTAYGGRGCAGGFTGGCHPEEGHFLTKLLIYRAKRGPGAARATGYTIYTSSPVPYLQSDGIIPIR